MEIKPFIKWAGGKYRLFEQLQPKLPKELDNGSIRSYYEPFLGGGGMFFKLIQQCKFDSIYLSDLNEELIIAYQVVRSNVQELLDYLDQYKKKYDKLNEKDKELYYYEMRTAYNVQRFNINFKKYSELWVPRAAQMIFLNKTCYNGLFRQNLKGEFNVPFGKNYNIQIIDSGNLLNVSDILKGVNIECCDFSLTCNRVNDNSFVYFDPPYNPVSKTANFTNYCKNDFSKNDQLRLSKLFKKLDMKGAKLMLSNSYMSDDNIIGEIYKNYSSSYIYSQRTMPSVISKRGKIKELLITNY